MIANITTSSIEQSMSSNIFVDSLDNARLSNEHDIEGKIVEVDTHNESS